MNRLHLAATRTIGSGIIIHGLRGLTALPIDDWVRSQRGGYWQFLTVHGYLPLFPNLFNRPDWLSFPGLWRPWLPCYWRLSHKYTHLVRPSQKSSASFSRYPSQFVCPCVVYSNRTKHVTAFKIAAVVSLVYWPLKLIGGLLFDRNNICPPNDTTLMCVHIPLSVDLGLHAVPFLSAIVECWGAGTRQYSRLEITLAVAICALYISWVEYLGSLNGSCEQICSRNCILTSDTWQLSPLPVSHRVTRMQNGCLLRCNCVGVVVIIGDQRELHCFRQSVSLIVVVRLVGARYVHHTLIN
jgi:hypothetical protein